MSALTLGLRSPQLLPLDASPLRPDLLAGLGIPEIEALPLQLGNRRVALGDLFRVRAGERDRLVIEGASDAFDRLGEGLGAGSLEIEGDAGDFLGLGMTGGAIRLSGRAAAFAGAGMKGGRLTIGGDAGDFLAAALPGEMRGMQGGVIEVGGAAGDRVGDRMRRGLVLVAGAAGSHAAARMIGGTIVAGAGVGPAAGFQMRRGTLVTTTMPDPSRPTFRDHGRVEQPWLGLLARELAALGWKAPLPAGAGWWTRRLGGDLGCDGSGEILLAA